MLFLRGVALAAACLAIASPGWSAPPAATSSAPSSQAGALFKECADCPTMVVIGPGRFVMGSAGGGVAATAKEESPQREVTIARPFALAQTHVTVAQFARFVSETGYPVTPGCNLFPASGPKLYALDSAASFRNPGFKGSADDPAVCISWHDATAYIAWINKQAGGAKPLYRLPTEAEWEFAAGGGTTTAFFWGEDRAQACKFANSADLSGKRIYPQWETPNCDDGYAFTAPVGSYQPNPYGLYDMVGNAWQWTQDCWHETYEGAPTDGSAWLTGSDCSRRAARGGAWRGDFRGLRTAGRGFDPADSRWATVGFRLARTLD